MKCYKFDSTTKEENLFFLNIQNEKIVNFCIMNHRNDSLNLRLMNNTIYQLECNLSMKVN